MRPALLVFAYAMAVAWFVPPLLTRLTARGISARLGLTAWLTAMASVLACATVALEFLVRAAASGWPGLAEAVCRSVAGQACTPTFYRSALFEAGLGAAAIVAALAAAVLAWHYGRSVQQARRRTRAHAEAARMTGRRLPDAGAPALGAAVLDAAALDAVVLDAVVLDAPQAVAYCVGGRPATIVLTTGALAVLDPAQLSAVLAHERAHLAGRHHLLIALTRALAVSFPAVPLFTRGPDEVARLAEMRADDAAVRRSGRRTLIAALLAMSTGTSLPAAALRTAALTGTALGATACAVTDRVQRLLEPPRRGRRARYGAALVTVTLLLALLSGLAAAFAGPLAAHGLHAG
jgi:Zn-dependent protease with chaperone function